MIWAHPFVLGLVPVALVAVWLLTRRARGTDELSLLNIHRLWADRHGLSDRPAATRRRLPRGVCLAAGACAALLALARPQWGEVAEQSYDRSREVMLALDLSRSMLADDVSPSRLARAKLLISSLLDQLAGERVGLIVFSGTAFVQSPLSADYEVLREFLDELDPSFLPEGGTDYESMLRAAVQGFGQQGGGDRYLVVLSDGEALDENWKALIPALREHGIRVIGLGIGTPEGALVPDGNGGLVKDEHGAAVLSRLEPRTLEELAAETGGAYRDAATWVDIAELVDTTVAHGMKGNYVEQRNVRLQDRYQWFLAPALLLILLSYWLEFPVSPLARALPRRGRRPHPASAPAIAAALLGLAAWHSPRPAFAAVSDVPAHLSGTATQPNQLTATVAELSNKPHLAPPDYARLATDTIAFASRPGAPTDASRAGVIDDALAAVDRGEAADSRAADWPSLRARLEQLKQVKEPPPQNQEPNQSQPQQGQSGQRDHQHQREAGGGQQQPNANQSGQGGPTSDQTGSGSSQARQDTQGDGKRSPVSDEDRQGNENHEGGNAGNRAQESRKGDAVAHDPSQGAGSDRPSSGRRAAEADAGSDASDRRQTAGEVQREDDLKPLDTADAGLADRDPNDAMDDVPPAAHPGPADHAQPAQSPPPMRMVGGGPALQGDGPRGDTALAEALGKLERVKDGDAPAVLFERMNRAEGQPRAEKRGKNW
jgi:Ca-activated chloride channel family protein